MEHKIKQIEIKNFRNIVYDKIVLDGESIIVAGVNEVGKTNRLQAILWALSGTMFDGTVRDALSNITPYNADSDLETSVSITFMNEQEFTKTYTRPYTLNELGEKVYKVGKTTYSLNGGKPLSRLAEGDIFVLQQLGLQELSNRFKSTNISLSKINLPYLFTNTVGIKSLDSNTQRALIDDIVGKVDAYEIAKGNIKYALLLPELEKNNNDLNALREKTRYTIENKEKGLKQQVLVANTVLQELELEATKTVDETVIKETKERIANLKKALIELQVKKENISKGSTTQIDLELANIETEKLKLEKEIRDKYEKDLNAFNLTSNANLIKEKEKTILELQYKVRESQTILDGAKRDLENANSKLESAKILNETYNQKAKVLKEKYSLLKNAKPSNNGAEITCPHCDNTFNISESKEHLEIHKKDIERQLNEVIKIVNDLTVEKQQNDINIIDLQQAVIKAQQNVTQKSTAHNNNLEIRNKLETELNELRESDIKDITFKPQLDFNTPTMLDLANREKVLKTEKIGVLGNQEEALQKVDNDILEVENQIAELEPLTLSESVRNANLKALQEKRVAYEKLINTLSEYLEMYSLTKDLLVDMFKETENRIEAKFGRDIYFKLYEPNATDGGETYKTVCEMYVRDGFDRLVPALANGVSTSMQEVKIVEFIEKLKEHYELPESVILIDRLESLDNQKRLLLGKKNQIISTQVVSVSAEKTITYNKLN